MRTGSLQSGPLFRCGGDQAFVVGDDFGGDEGAPAGVVFDHHVADVGGPEVEDGAGGVGGGVEDAVVLEEVLEEGVEVVRDAGFLGGADVAFLAVEDGVDVEAEGVFEDHRGQDMAFAREMVLASHSPENSCRVPSQQLG